MMLFGLFAIAYGIFFMYVRMFAIFNPEITTLAGLVSSGVGLLVLPLARRELREDHAIST